MNQNVFNTLLLPIKALSASITSIINQQCHWQKLFFDDFVRKLMFAYVEQVSSLRNLPVVLQTGEKCRQLGLEYTPFSTMKDGFSRFESRYFRELFEAAVQTLDLKRIQSVYELGLFQVIDGSLFPTLMRMGWTDYRKAKNAFKLHLSFELNRMIPTEFWVGSGNSSERAFLESVLEKGVTYIADRGYGSFKLLTKVIEAGAFGIFRVKNNLLYEVRQALELTGDDWPGCFRQIRDELVVFSHDEDRNSLRLIQFEVFESRFRIVTNRLDLTTLEVIILYAWRWQIELFFKYLKRTLKGIHLYNHSQNGVEIQFYLLMTLAILLLKLKQDCQEAEQLAATEKESRRDQEKWPATKESPPEWIKRMGRVFAESWKISQKWLLILRNSLTKIIGDELRQMLNSC